MDVRGNEPDAAPRIKTIASIEEEVEKGIEW